MKLTDFGMKYSYDDLKVSHTRWEGYCVFCKFSTKHATLFGREMVCVRCMNCGRDERIIPVRHR